MPQPVTITNNQEVADLFGKGSIVVVNDDMPFILSQSLYGQWGISINLSMQDKQQEGLETDHVNDIVEELVRIDKRSFFQCGSLITPGVHRSPENAWNAAAATLRALAEACEKRAAQVMDDVKRTTKPAMKPKLIKREEVRTTRKLPDRGRRP